MQKLVADREAFVKQMPASLIWQVFATGGFTAGFVYWLIAGRSA